MLPLVKGGSLFPALALPKRCVFFAQQAVFLQEPSIFISQFVALVLHLFQLGFQLFTAGTRYCACCFAWLHLFRVRCACGPRLSGAHGAKAKKNPI